MICLHILGDNNPFQEEIEAEKNRAHKSPFKAMPLPSFYQEPAPPKMEIKKVKKLLVKHGVIFF